MNMNTARLAELADLIEDNQERFDMQEWIQGWNWEAAGNRRPIEAVALFNPLETVCDTVGCIAGWAVSKWGHELLGPDGHLADFSGIEWVGAGSRILGLEREVAAHLFHATYMGTAEVVATLRHLATLDHDPDYYEILDITCWIIDRHRDITR